MRSERPLVLLVEDNAADAEFMLEALDAGRFGARVVVVRNGVEALRLLGCGDPPERIPADRLPRLVILDIKLPLVTGPEVLEAMRANPATRRVPVVMFTSSALAGDVANCYRLGVNSYVQKPVEFERFRDVVRKLGDYWLSLNLPPGPQGDASGTLG